MGRTFRGYTEQKFSALGSGRNEQRSVPPMATAKPEQVEHPQQFSLGSDSPVRDASRPPWLAPPDARLRRTAADAETGTHTLKKTLGAKGLIALGIGAIIGAGLFSELFWLVY